MSLLLLFRGSSGGGGAYTASISETVTLAESLAVFSSTSAAVAETVTLAESLTAQLAASPGLAETIALSEALAAVYDAVASLVETVTLSDGVAGDIGGAGVDLSETIALSESLTVLYSATAALAETVTLSEALASQYTGTAAVAETVALSELLVVSRSTSASVAEAVTLVEALAASCSMSAAVSETLALAEVLASQYTGTAAVAETVTLAEALAASRGALAGVSETMTLAEALLAGLGVSASLSETLALAEALFTQFTGSVDLNETVTLGEGLSELVQSLRGGNVVSLPLAVGADVGTQRPIALVHGATLSLLMTIKQANGATANSGTVTFSLKKLAGDEPFFTKTANVGAALTLLPVNTQALAAGYYLYTLTLTQGLANMVLVYNSPFYLAQRALTLPKNYALTAPVVVPPGTFLNDFSVAGWVLDASRPAPYIPQDGAETVRLTKGEGARITVTVQKASGEYVNGGQLVFTLKKTPNASPIVEQVLTAVGTGTVFVVLPSVIAKMPVGMYVYDVWLLNEGGTKTPVVPLSTFRLD